MRWLNLHIVLCILSVIGIGNICAQQHQLSVQSSAHGNAHTYNIDHGATVTLLATADIGYQFVQWSDGVTANPRTIIITDDASLVAMFDAETGGVTPTQYTVTVCANDCSTPHQKQYNEGTILNLVAQAKVGYKFKRWSDGNTNNPRLVTVNSDATYQAEFEAYATAIPTYKVTAKAENASTHVEGNYPAGTKITLVAQPIADGCNDFVHWEDASTNATRKVVVNGDASYTATFSLKQYTVTTDVDNSSQGSVQVEIN